MVALHKVQLPEEEESYLAKTQLTTIYCGVPQDTLTDCKEDDHESSRFEAG